ncbi:hypothetical protein BHM03_00051028 [Ensete ventricosum]|nr:hypothetical protein BHM03_00051028 [Ensete ventricosum]
MNGGPYRYSWQREQSNRGCRRDGAGKQVLKSSSAAYGVGKVSLLVGADATVVVHKEDGLVQKNASVEELRKPTGSNRGRESRRTRSLQLRLRRETVV